ncbi:MAG: DUF4315 family protein [Neglectibacter timonensis]
MRNWKKFGEKAAEWQAKSGAGKAKQEEENSRDVQAVRSLKLTPAQLMAFERPQNSFTASGHTDPKPEHPKGGQPMKKINTAGWRRWSPAFVCLDLYIRFMHKQ